MKEAAQFCHCIELTGSANCHSLQAHSLIVQRAVKNLKVDNKNAQNFSNFEDFLLLCLKWLERMLFCNLICVIVNEVHLFYSKGIPKHIPCKINLNKICVLTN